MPFIFSLRLYLLTHKINDLKQCTLQNFVTCYYLYHSLFSLLPSPPPPPPPPPTPPPKKKKKKKKIIPSTAHTVSVYGYDRRDLGFLVLQPAGRPLALHGVGGPDIRHPHGRFHPVSPGGAQVVRGAELCGELRPHPYCSGRVGRVEHLTRATRVLGCLIERLCWKILMGREMHRIDKL